MKLLVVAHDHASPDGPIGQRFADHGYEVVRHLVVPAEHFADPGVPAAFPAFDSFDAVVLMGAPWSTYDTDLIGSWVPDELEQVRRADAAGVPVLGICFGGQLLAAAHGGTVTASTRPEIGWYDVESSAPEVVPGGPWFEWHGDTWTLPPHAREVARNDNASQAFILRQNLAVQFHPELTAATLAGWLGNGGDAHVAAFGLDLDTLLAETAERDARSRERAHSLVDGFLDHVAGSRG